jgi:hypothetical protein
VIPSAQSGTGDWNPPSEHAHQICTDPEDSPPASQRRRSNDGSRVDVPGIRPRLPTPALFPFPHRRKRERERLVANAATSAPRSQGLVGVPVDTAVGVHSTVPRAPPPPRSSGRGRHGSSPVPRQRHRSSTSTATAAPLVTEPAR